MALKGNNKKIQQDLERCFKCLSWQVTGRGKTHSPSNFILANLVQTDMWLCASKATKELRKNPCLVPHFPFSGLCCLHIGEYNAHYDHSSPAPFPDSSSADFKHSLFTEMGKFHSIYISLNIYVIKYLRCEALGLKHLK